MSSESCTTAVYSPRDRWRNCAKDTGRKTWKIYSCKWCNHELEKHRHGLSQGIEGLIARPAHGDFHGRRADRVDAPVNHWDGAVVGGAFWQGHAGIPRGD